MGRLPKHTVFSALGQQQKRLPTLEEYACLLMPTDFKLDGVEINNIGAVTNTNPESVAVVQTSSRHFRFMPGPEFCPRLYRGQNRYYEPCVPSLYRNQTPINKIYRAAKWVELGLAICEHPVALWLRGLEIEGLEFGFNFQSIAQHYGFPSALLDFSRSKDVAMFFATCGYNAKTDEYYPLESGTAVLYTIDLRRMIMERDPNSSPVPLGLELLPRPEAQKAFGIRLLPGQNLNSKSWSQNIIFNITEQQSKLYYEMFDGGRALLPSNPFDSHIRFLRDNDAIPKPVIEYGMKIGVLPRHPCGIDAAAGALEFAGYRVLDDMHAIEPSVIAAAADDWNARVPAFLEKITMRGIAMTDERVRRCGASP